MAYINVENTTEDKIKSCLSVYKKVKWKGRNIRVEYAKPTYLEKLERRWERERALEKELRLNTVTVNEKPLFTNKKKFVKPINNDDGVVIMFKNNGESDSDDDDDDEENDDNNGNEIDLNNQGMDIEEGNNKHMIDEIYTLNKDYDYFHLVKEEDEKIYEVAETEVKKGGFRFLPDRTNEENKSTDDSNNKKRKSPSEDVVSEAPTIPQKKAENKFIPIFSFMFAEPSGTSKRKNNKAYEDHLTEIITSGDSFRRMESLDEVKEQWRSTRSFLRKDAKKKHKHSVKKIRSLHIKA